MNQNLQIVYHKLKYPSWHLTSVREQISLNKQGCSLALDIDCVIIGTKFNNQTAENLAAMSNSPPFLELYPSPPKLADISGAKRQIWSCFTKQTDSDT